MLNFKEFQEYIKSNVKDYLPENYKDADIQFTDVVKNNDVHLTGVLIKKENETLTPNIYINELYEKYSRGMNLDEIVGDIADLRIEHDPPEEAQAIGSIFTNYEMVKQRLEIHLCDMELNRDKLKNQVYTEQGDFAATYHIKIGGDGMLRGSAAVTPNLLKGWGITEEQLREDSLRAEHSKGAVFTDIEALDAEKMFGLKPINLLDKQNDIIDNRETAACGAIFMDYRNDVDAKAEHLILYGHQMKDNSMFKQLNGYKEEIFYKEHPNIKLYLHEQKYEYEITAVYVTDVANGGGYYNYLHWNTRKEQLNYLQQKMAGYQIYDTGKKVMETDELLSLSTCEYSSDNGRLIVQARRKGEMTDGKQII